MRLIQAPRPGCQPTRRRLRGIDARLSQLQSNGAGQGERSRSRTETRPCEASVEANDAAAPAAKARRTGGLMVRRRIRATRRTVAPRITGIATVRDSRFASLRVNRRHLA